MDSQHIYDSLKDIIQMVSDIKVDVARNTESLDYHIKRTDINEKRLELMEQQYAKFIGFFSIGGWILGVAATIMTLLSRLHIL